MLLDEFSGIITRQAIASKASYQLSYHRDTWHAIIRFQDDPSTIHPVYADTLHDLARRSLFVMQA